MSEESQNIGGIAVTAQSRRLNAQRRRRLLVLISFFPLVVLPTCLSIIYFAFLASDRYASEIKFTIRAPGNVAPASDLFGALTGLTGSGSTKTDSYITVDFLESRELVEILEEEIDLRTIYSRADVDWFSRFNPDQAKEELVDYLRWRIGVFFDTSSQIISVEVQAFTPEDAKLVASKILEVSEKLVNRLSDKARLDTLKSAEDEVARAEIRLREHRKRISNFREKEQDIDPTKTVETQQLILGQIQSELGTARAQLKSMRRFLDIDAPSMKVLQSKIKALEFQLAQERAKLGLGLADNLEGDATLSTRVGEYEELAVDLEFLQQAYLLSLTSLERARVEADRQQRYVATFILPRIAEEPKYPHRILNIFLVAVFSFIFWGVGVIAVYTVREHIT